MASMTENKVEVMDYTTGRWWINKHAEETKEEEDESMDSTIAICVLMAWIIIPIMQWLNFG